MSNRGGGVTLLHFFITTYGWLSYFISTFSYSQRLWLDLCLIFICFCWLANEYEKLKKKLKRFSESLGLLNTTDCCMMMMVFFIVCATNICRINHVCVWISFRSRLIIIDSCLMFIKLFFFCFCFRCCCCCCLLAGCLAGWFLWLAVYVTNGFWPRVWVARKWFFLAIAIVAITVRWYSVFFLFHFVAVGGLFTKKTIC